MNHCISFIWFSLDNVDGWNSVSIHFLAAASSAKAGPVIADDAAINANAPVVIKMRVLVAGPLLISEYRMVTPSVCGNIRPRVDPGSALFASPKRRRILQPPKQTKYGGEPEARQFNPFSD
ncbi:MAG TPA: hypothetical protein VKS24_17790 [Bradyrhizobium sp.]|nr:hypothetical protein [Bradyrhizobium sp.]